VRKCFKFLLQVAQLKTAATSFHEQWMNMFQLKFATFKLQLKALVQEMYVSPEIKETIKSRPCASNVNVTGS
jgi:hypothetical protein